MISLKNFKLLNYFLAALGLALALAFVFTGPRELTCLVNLDLRLAALFYE